MWGDHLAESFLEQSVASPSFLMPAVGKLLKWSDQWSSVEFIIGVLGEGGNLRCTSLRSCELSPSPQSGPSQCKQLPVGELTTCWTSSSLKRLHLFEWFVSSMSFASQQFVKFWQQVKHLLSRFPTYGGFCIKDLLKLRFHRHCQVQQRERKPEAWASHHSASQEHPSRKSTGTCQGGFCIFWHFWGVKWNHLSIFVKILTFSRISDIYFTLCVSWTTLHHWTSMFVKWKRLTLHPIFI